jgi:hypothetical protein
MAHPEGWWFPEASHFYVEAPSGVDIDVVGEAADGAAAITARRNWYRTWC